MSKSKVGRNHLCPCGSGLKYKKCCLQQDQGGANQNPLGSLTHKDPKGKRWLKDLESRLEESGTLQKYMDMVSPLLPPETSLEQKEEVARLRMMYDQWKDHQVIWPWSSRLSALASQDPIKKARPYLDELWYGSQYRFMMKGAHLIVSPSVHQEGVVFGVLNQAHLILEIQEFSDFHIYILDVYLV